MILNKNFIFCRLHSLTSLNPISVFVHQRKASFLIGAGDLSVLQTDSWKKNKSCLMIESITLCISRHLPLLFVVAAMASAMASVLILTSKGAVQSVDREKRLSEKFHSNFCHKSTANGRVLGSIRQGVQNTSTILVGERHSGSSLDTRGWWSWRSIKIPKC